MSATTPVTLVTAASRGMGAAIARELACRGHSLALLARGKEVESLAAELGALAVRGSVEATDDLAALVDAARSRYGRIDGAVVNTGHAAKGELLELSDADWHRGVDLLLLPTIRLARLLTPEMTERGKGAIVNISSFAAAEPGLRFPVSGTVRAGLGQFAKLFAQRYGRFGVRMNNLLPGWIETYPVDAEAIAAIPAARAGTPEEVAKVVSFLLSDDASYINGQSLRIDGGMVRAV